MSSSLKPVKEEGDNESEASFDPKGVSSRGKTEEMINLKRSDGVKHDLVTVFNRGGISGISNDTLQSTRDSKKPVPTNEINISRSDGKTHDIHAVMRSYSEASFGKNPTATINSGKSTGFSWNRMTPKITFSKSVNSTHVERSPDKRPSIKDSTNFHPSAVRVVHMSDSFNLLKASSKKLFLPHGDILVHSGNFSIEGTEDEFGAFDSWLASVKELYHYRVVCLGHRDVRRFGTEWDVFRALLPNATHVLCNEEAVILGIRFFAIPWFWGCKFNYSMKINAPSQSVPKYSDIPEGIDVLITHGPALGRLDRTVEGESVGSSELHDALRRVKPSVHLHGHVTEARGMIPAFGHMPLTLNSCVCEKSRTVMYACPHVIKLSQVFNSEGLSSKNTWECTIDSLM